MFWSWMVLKWLLHDVNQCPVCTCPHSELDQTDVAYPYRDTESVKRAVIAARSEHLDADGEVKDRHKEEVAHFFNIIPDIMSDIIHDIIPDIF